MNTQYVLRRPLRLPKKYSTRDEEFKDVLGEQRFNYASGTRVFEMPEMDTYCESENKATIDRVAHWAEKLWGFLLTKTEERIAATTVKNINGKEIKTTGTGIDGAASGSGDNAVKDSKSDSENVVQSETSSENNADSSGDSSSQNTEDQSPTSFSPSSIFSALSSTSFPTSLSSLQNLFPQPNLADLDEKRRLAQLAKLPLPFGSKVPPLTLGDGTMLDGDALVRVLQETITWLNNDDLDSFFVAVKTVRVKTVRKTRRRIFISYFYKLELI
jgi:hypothetical protein